MSLERNAKLISRKFIHYLIPSILMIFAMQFSSLLDGILIGNMISGEALTATSLVMPVLYVIQAPGFAIGIGGSIVIANKLGKRDIEGAKKAFSLSIIIALAFSLVFATLAFPVSSPLANLFGEASYEYSYEFILMYLLTDPIITIALLLGNFMAVDNNPRLSSIFFIVSNVAKVGLEILLINLFKQTGGNGMFGAALSTPAGFLVAFAVLPFYFKSSKRMLKFTFKIRHEKVFDIFKSSSTSGINMILTAIQMFIVNIYIGKLITDPVDLLAFGLISNVVFVFDLFCGGIINVIPNIVGILYGEKDYYSLKSITRKVFWINFIVTASITALIAILPNVYCIIFGYSDQEHMGYVSYLIRIYLLSFIPYEINKFSMNYYPSIDKNIPSLIVVFLRELVIVLPVTLGLLFSQGILGYCIACAVTEIATVLITYIFILIYNKRKKTHGIFMFEDGDIESFDTSMDDDITNASKISMQLTEFARSHGVEERESQIVGLAAEEIVNNIITYGYRHNHKNYIDVGLKKVNDILVLRIRDDGMPFDPTKYEFDNDENYSTSGIQLISKLTDKMTYMRVLSLNNTIFEIKIGRKE